MPWTLIYSERAYHQIHDLPDMVRNRIARKLEAVAEDPFLHVRKLKDAPLYSVRVGEYPVLCAISTMKVIICVVKMEHRKNVYRDI